MTQVFRTRVRVLFPLLIFAIAACLNACAAASTGLPTANADQARAQTLIAQGTPASFLGTKVARPEKTNAPGDGNAQSTLPASTTDAGKPSPNPTRVARRTLEAQTRQAGKPTAPPNAAEPTEPPEGFEPTATPPPPSRAQRDNSQFARILDSDFRLVSSRNRRPRYESHQRDGVWLD